MFIMLETQEQPLQMVQLSQAYTNKHFPTMQAILPFSWYPGLKICALCLVFEPGTNMTRFVEPDGAGMDPVNIESIRIGLLMVSEQEIAEAEDDKTYSLAGQQIVAAAGAVAGGNTHPRDNRFRLAFNTTVKIRNRRVEN